MSLLMQALRKAERAKHGEVMTEPHGEDGLQLEPLETDVQKAAAASEHSPAGGASFTLEPLEPASSSSDADAGATADDEDIPVIPATEAMHDPVPPQARPGLRRGAVAGLRAAELQDGHTVAGPSADEHAAAQAAAEARRAADMPHGPGLSAGGLSTEPPPHAAPPTSAQTAAQTGASSRTTPGGSGAAISADDAFFAERSPLRNGAPLGAARNPGSASEHLGRPRAGNGQAAADGSAAWNRTGAAPRASAAGSRQRIAMLGGLLGAVVIGMGYLYWRGISSPGSGAALPPVPMPGMGGEAAAPAVTPGAVQGAMIPGVESVQATVDGAGGAGAGGVGGVAGHAAGSVAGISGGVQPAAAPPGAAGGITADAGAPRAAQAAATSTAAAAPRPPDRVVVPTPEALSAIDDPAIRAEAMRDAAERSARAARDADVPHPGGVQYGPEAPILADARTSRNGATSLAGGAAGGSNTGAVRSRSTRTATSGAAATVAGSAANGAASGAGAAGSTTVSISGGTPGAPSATDVHIVRNNVTPQVNPTLQNAWSAYQAGDLAAARQQYDMALLQDPNNRDALLGSAAVANKERNGQQAAAHYMRLLELDPNDAEALSGLVALRPGDLSQAETRLKGLLRTTPESGPLLFTLGNLYAKQGRWSEAQQAYFRAFSAAPSNPDYAFNLAIGLDRLNQPRLAQDYYRKALTLAQSAPVGFDQNAVRRRLAELGAPAP